MPVTSMALLNITAWQSLVARQRVQRPDVHTCPVTPVPLPTQTSQAVDLINLQLVAIVVEPHPSGTKMSQASGGESGFEFLKGSEISLNELRDFARRRIRCRGRIRCHALPIEIVVPNLGRLIVYRSG